MRKSKKEIQLTSYDELLGIDETVDEKMEETAESIRNYGVLNPGLVRPRVEGRYELVAGHRRKRGCELAGKDTMPVLVRNYTDDEAVVIMLDSNIQREHILPSAKAFAYKLKMEALKHQGIKSTDGTDTAELVGKEAGDSGRKVQRYIRLTKLLPELLELVDVGKIKILPAVSLSYLPDEEQLWVLKCITENSVTVSGTIAETLKKHSAEGKLTELAVELILHEDKKDMEKVILPRTKINQYFPKEYSRQQIEQVIFELLEDWKNVIKKGKEEKQNGKEKNGF